MPITYQRFGWKHFVVSLIGVPLLAFTFMSSFNIIPSSQIVSGDKLIDRDIKFLKYIGGLTGEETIEYFYSAGLFSIEEDGNFYTKKRVVSYWEDTDTKETMVESAEYSDISSIETNYSTNFMQDTEITIMRNDGTGFRLIVSSEMKKDIIFVAGLNQFWSYQKHSQADQ